MTKPRRRLEAEAARKLILDAAEKRLDRELPALPELTGEPSRWMVAAPDAPVAVGRDERDQMSAGRRNDLDDEGSGERGQPAQSALFPRGDERPYRRIVLDRRARGREREPQAGALATALDRPRDGGAAAGAERTGESRQRGCATRARGGAREGADDAPAGKKQVEEHTPTRYGGSNHVSVPDVRRTCDGISRASSTRRAPAARAAPRCSDGTS